MLDALLRRSPDEEPGPGESFRVNDAVLLHVSGEDFYGEIVEVNQSERMAVVQLVPKNVFVTVAFDDMEPTINENFGPNITTDSINTPRPSNMD